MAIRIQPRKLLRRKAAALAANEDGATAIEFGLIALPFIGIMLAIFQTGLLLFTAESVEAAVAEASRSILTGEVQSGTITSTTQFRDQLLCTPTAPRRRVLPSYIDCSRLVIDVRQVTSFATADMSRTFYNSPTTFDPGGAGCIAAVRVAYPMSVYFPIPTVSGTNTAGQNTFNGSLTYMIVSTAIFRNEPFATNGSTC